MSLDTTTLTVAEAGRLLRGRTLRATDLADAALARIDADNARLNAFIAVTAEAARVQAARADAELAAGVDRGALHGIPISLKDLFDVEGLPTTAASRVREGHVATADAAIVRNLKRAGAVLVGKTNLHEFALGTTSEDSAFGPARHPVDPSRSPGGSSGGSAASVVAGMSFATVGSDTGGSIRIPAAACGLVGLKPAFGEVSCEGVVPLSRRLDHVGPLARTVADARLLFHVLAGRRTAAHGPDTASLSGLTAGLPRGYLFERLQDDVRAAFERALARLRGAGLDTRDVALPHAAETPAVYLTLCLAEAAAIHARTLEAMGDLYTKPVRLRLEMGRYIPGEDYVRALAGQRLLRAEVDAALAGVDVLVLPTLPIVAPPIGAATVRVGEADEPVRNIMLRLTQLFNLTRHPAITLPIGSSAEGLPIGLQIVGTATDRLLDVAEAFEAALGE
jgi:aspartyl-tRNA(Asn)/glutamyl-tRNA(Gln) amidotransferase subunit A